MYAFCGLFINKLHFEVDSLNTVDSYLTWEG